jgi:hypothetical protein
VASAGLTPGQNSLGQCVWAVVGAAMDEDTDAIEYLLTGLTETELGAVITCMAGIIGHSTAAAHGQQDARAMAAAYAVQYAAAGGTGE